MPSPKPPKLATTRAREELAWSLSVKGHTLREIAARVESEGLGRISFQAVAKMLHRIGERELRELQGRVGREKARQHRTLDGIIRAAWLAYEKSKRPRRSRKVRKFRVGDKDAREITRIVSSSCGDPRFLEVIRHALADQRAIWGLDATPADRPSRPVHVDPVAAARALRAATATPEGPDDDDDDDDPEGPRLLVEPTWPVPGADPGAVREG